MSATAVLVLGDVGGLGGYHVGDEAMAEALVRALTDRSNIDATLISGDVEETTERYGWNAVPRIGFPGGRGAEGERSARLRAVLEAARGESEALAWDDPAWSVIHAVAATDVVVISGGGNLNSNWPEHIYERAALGQLAVRYSKRLVVSGQMLGPVIEEDHGQLLAQLLGTASLVSVRDHESAKLALRLGVPQERLSLLVDDAADLAPSSLDVPVGGYVAATFSDYSGALDSDEYLAAVVRLVRSALETFDLPVVLLAHDGRADENGLTGDFSFHARLTAVLSDPRVRSLGAMSASDVAAWTRGATAVLSSRYHPVVFALAGAVPALAVGVDAYTQIKLHGALENYGLGDYALSIGLLTDGDVDEAVASFKDNGPRIRNHLIELVPLRKVEQGEWWDLILETIALPLGNPAPRRIELSDQPVFDGGDWARYARRLFSWSLRYFRSTDADRAAMSQELQRFEARAGEVEALESEVGSLRDEVRDLEVALAEAREESAIAGEVTSRLLARLSQVGQDLESSREVARAERFNTEAALGEVARLAGEVQSAASAHAELDRLLATKTIRALRIPRQLYAEALSAARRVRSIFHTR